MSKSISAKQLMYSVSAYIIASALLTSNLYYFAKNDSWLSVLIGFAASLLMIGIYGVLTMRYPGFSLIEINDAVFGSIIGKAVSVFYIFYFLSLSYFNTRDLSDFVKSMLLPGTPMLIISVVFLSLCAFAVRKGPVVMTRYGFILAFTAIAAILLNSGLLLNRAEPANLLPSFTLPVRNYLIGAHIVTMLPFCEIMSFMMLAPYLDKPQSLGQAMRRGLYIGAATLMLIVLRDIIVQGKFITIFSMPTFSSIRLIDIGDILTRLEIIYAIILMGLLFFKISIVYFATVSGISRLVKFGSYRPFIYVFGALIIVYASASFEAVSEHVRWNLTAAATYSTFFLLVLPVLTLLVSAVRGAVQKQSVKSQECM